MIRIFLFIFAGISVAITSGYAMYYAEELCTGVTIIDLSLAIIGGTLALAMIVGGISMIVAAMSGDAEAKPVIRRKQANHSDNHSEDAGALGAFGAFLLAIVVAVIAGA
jgi:hypothetical protein